MKNVRREIVDSWEISFVLSPYCLSMFEMMVMWMQIISGKEWLNTSKEFCLGD